MNRTRFGALPLAPTFALVGLWTSLCCLGAPGVFARDALQTEAAPAPAKPAGDDGTDDEGEAAATDDGEGTPAPAQEGDSVFMPQVDGAATEEAASEAPEGASDAEAPEGASDAEAVTETPPAPTDAPVEASNAADADASTPTGEARVTFLVTEVQVSEDVPVAAEDARDLLANRFGRLGDKVEVRSLGDVKTSLDKAALMSALGGDADEVAKVSDMLDVDRVVHGRIAKVGNVIDVSVRVINVRESSVEMAMSRRLKADSDPSLIVAVLDKQADKLLAWVLDTYTDGETSDAFKALKAKKLKPRSRADAAEAATATATEETPPAAVEPDSVSFRFTWLGILGGVVAGSGLGIIAAAGLAGVAGSFANLNASTLPYLSEGTVAIGGVLILAVGIGVIIADHYLFSE